MGRFKDNALTRVFGRKDARGADVSTGGPSVAGEDVGGLERQRRFKVDEELSTSGRIPMSIEEWRRRETQASVALTIPRIEVNTLHVPSDLHMRSSSKNLDGVSCAETSVVGRRDKNSSPQDTFVTHVANGRQYSAVSLRSGCAAETRRNSTHPETTERIPTVAPSFARGPRGWSRYSQVSEEYSCPVTEVQQASVNKAGMTARASQRHRAEIPATACCCRVPNHPQSNTSGQACGCRAPYTPQPQKPALCRKQHSSCNKCGCSPAAILPSGYVETMTYTYPCFDSNCQASSCAHVVSESRPKLEARQMSSIVAVQPASCVGGTVCTQCPSPAQATSVSTACTPGVQAPTHGTTTTTTTTQTSTTTLTYQTITYPDGRSVTRLLPRDETVSQGPAVVPQTLDNQGGCSDRWPMSAGSTFLQTQHTGGVAVLQSQPLAPPMPLMAAPAITSRLDLVRNVGGIRGHRAVPVIIPLNTTCGTPYFGVST